MQKKLTSMKWIVFCYQAQLMRWMQLIGFILYASGSQTVVHVPVVVRKGLQGGTPAGLPSVFLHKKLHSQLLLYFCLPGSVNKFLHFCVLALLVLKIGHYNFSPPFCTCRFCAKPSFLNFWSNDIWLNAFFWNKLVRGDSMFPTNGTRSEKLWGNTALRYSFVDWYKTTHEGDFQHFSKKLGFTIWRLF